ncbi:MAG TPA: alpha/beta hydrolase [Candidatus Limnocylindrales bacterium]|jgi:pimeloyl-ACP methyl ester carboxylesterase
MAATTDPATRAPGRRRRSTHPDPQDPDGDRTADVADARHWTAVGPRDATTIVFLHGTRLSRAQWAPQLRRLSGSYRCVSVDLPGHGTRAAEPFTITAATAAVVAAIDAEAASGRALVVGLSLGGYMALETAEAYPDRVLGLVLAGCSAEPVGPSSAPFRAFATLMERLSPGVLRVLNVAFFRARYRRPIAEPIIEGGFWHAGGARAIRILLGRRFIDRLSRLWTPVTIVNGALDPVFGPGGDPWASAARRGRHVLIPWALHLSNLDRPTTFARIVAGAAEDALAHPGVAG